MKLNPHGRVVVINNIIGLLKADVFTRSEPF